MDNACEKYHSAVPENTDATTRPEIDEPSAADQALIDAVYTRLDKRCVTATSFKTAQNPVELQHLVVANEQDPGTFYALGRIHQKGDNGKKYDALTVSCLHKQTGEIGIIMYFFPNTPPMYYCRSFLAYKSARDQKVWMKCGGVVGTVNEPDRYSFPQEKIAGLAIALTDATPNHRLTIAGARQLKRLGGTDVVMPTKFSILEPNLAPSEQGHIAGRPFAWPGWLGRMAGRMASSGVAR